MEKIKRGGGLCFHGGETEEVENKELPSGSSHEKRIEKNKENREKEK